MQVMLKLSLGNCVRLIELQYCYWTNAFHLKKKRAQLSSTCFDSHLLKSMSSSEMPAPTTHLI